MKFYKYLLAVSLISCFASCSNDEPIAPDAEEDASGEITRNEYDPLLLTQEELDLMMSEEIFSMNLFKSIANSTNENVVFSPIGVVQTLAMLVNGAEGSTKDEIINTLSHSEVCTTDVDKINTVNNRVFSYLLTADNTTTMVTANAIWSDNSLNIKPPFIEAVKEYYNAECFQTDFNNPGVSSSINSWVKEKTGGIISSVVPEGTMTSTPFVTVNTNYFKSTWALKDFDPANTRKRDFTNSDGSVSSVDMMHEPNMRIGFAQNQDFTCANIEFGNTAFTMTIMMPREGLTFDEIFSDAPDYKLRDAFHFPLGWQYDDVDVILPKFEITSTIKLQDILKATGINELFSENANLSGISNNFPAGKLYLDHTCSIKLEEKGVLSASETHSIWGTANLDFFPVIVPPTEFHVDRPFMFAIFNHSSHSMLYMGIIDKL